MDARGVAKIAERRKEKENRGKEEGGLRIKFLQRKKRGGGGKEREGGKIFLFVFGGSLEGGREGGEPYSDKAPFVLIVWRKRNLEQSLFSHTIPERGEKQNQETKVSNV